MDRLEVLATAAAAALFCACTGARKPDDCPASDGTRVRIFVESRAAGPVLLPGRAPGCVDGPAPAGLARRVEQVLATVPAALRPPLPVVLHLSPAAERGASQVLEYHRGGRALLAWPPALDLPDSVWLHELAHVTMGRTLAAEGFERGFREATEEAVADYYAAAIAGHPKLGPFAPDGRGTRDLRSPPPITPGAWESLALPNVRFDPHRLGWSLAAAAWQAQPTPGPLLEDLLQCTAHATPAAWLRRCPARSRATIGALLRGWLPEPLLR